MKIVIGIKNQKKAAQVVQILKELTYIETDIITKKNDRRYKRKTTHTRRF